MADKTGRWRCFLCGASKRGGWTEWDLHYRSYHYEPVKRGQSCPS